MQEMSKERRRFPRKKVEVIVRYRALSIPQEKFDAKSKKISWISVCLVVREQLAVGAFLTMEITFPDSDKPALCVGRVIWSRKSGLGPSPEGHPQFDHGFEFLQITDLERQRILNYLQSEQEKTKPEGWKTGIVRDISG